jgi:hypothetical protein
MSDALKRVVDKVKASSPKQRVSKSNRTLSLSEPQYKEFQAYCQARGLTTSAVVDDLIQAFMTQVADESKPVSLAQTPAKNG